MRPSERDGPIMAALRAAAPGAASGEDLARELGVSRVSVRKRIEALRAQGYVIDAVVGLGYTLVSCPDLPLPVEVEPLLTIPFWGPLSGGGVTRSTNDDCKALARFGVREGAVVLASEQTGGRGRLGRDWASPPGGVYFSALLRPGLAPSELVPLSLVAGVGLARGLETLGVQASLKWPNDVYVQGGKLAGVLIEMSAEAEAVEWMVVGCGVNVRRTDAAHPGAAYLCDVDDAAGPRLAEVAAACLDGVASAYFAFIAEGFAGLRAEYESRALLDGREVLVRDARGVERARGRVAGVDDSGRLVVQGPGGPVRVVAGDVTLRQGT